MAFLEGHLHPIDSWDDLDAGARELFGGLRTPEVGERMVATDNTGTHFLPEDHPQEVAAALEHWLAAMDTGSGGPSAVRPLV